MLKTFCCQSFDNTPVSHYECMFVFVKNLNKLTVNNVDRTYKSGTSLKKQPYSTYDDGIILIQFMTCELCRVKKKNNYIQIFKYQF